MTELKIHAGGFTQVNVVCVLFVNAREFQRIAQFLNIGLEHTVILPKLELKFLDSVFLTRYNSRRKGVPK